MNRIEEIIARLKAIDVRQDEIERKCDLENQGQFTDDLREEYRGLKEEYDNLKAEKKQLEDDAEMKRERSGRAEDFQPRQLERKTPSNSGAPHPSVQRDTAARSIEPTEDEPQMRRFTIPAQCKRHGSLRNFKGVTNGLQADERAYRFGQYCLAKISHDIPSRFRFTNAIKFCQNYIGDYLNTAHTETDATTGGEFLVPAEFSSDLIVLREEYGVARQLFDIEPMGTDVRNVPKRATGLTAYFPGEGNAITESNMTFSNIELVARKLAAIARISAELNADAVIAVGDRIAGEIAYAFANMEDSCAFIGDGSATYSGIMGAATRLQDVDGAGTDSAGLYTSTGGNTFAEFVIGDFTNTMALLPAYASRNPVWVTHKTVYHSTMQRLEAAAGGNTMLSLAAGNRADRPLFLGYPVYFSQVMPSTDSNSQVCALFGDFKLGAILGDRAMTSIMFSEHATVNSVSVFEQDQIAIRGTERFAMVVHGYGTSSAAGPIVGLESAAA